MTSDEKLEKYLELAQELCSLTQNMTDKVLESFYSQAYKKVRDQVLIGLGIKMSKTFECLLEDAKRKRPEAGHHLKTLVESFIYLLWVGREEDDKNAKLLLASVCASRAKFFRLTKDYPGSDEYARTWEDLSKGYKNGLEIEWKEFDSKLSRNIYKIAQESGMEEWYNRVYRLACEPAHIADLGEHIPKGVGLIDSKKAETPILGAIVYLYYGFDAMLKLLSEASNLYSLNFNDKIIDLKGRFATLLPLA